MRNPKCKSKDCEIVKANAGFMTIKEYWYCRTCKQEVSNKDTEKDELLKEIETLELEDPQYALDYTNFGLMYPNDPD